MSPCYVSQAVFKLLCSSDQSGVAFCVAGATNVPLCLALVFTGFFFSPNSYTFLQCLRLPQPHINRVRLYKVYVNLLFLGLLPTAVSATSR